MNHQSERLHMMLAYELELTAIDIAEMTSKRLEDFEINTAFRYISPDWLEKRYMEIELLIKITNEATGSDLISSVEQYEIERAEYEAYGSY